MKILKVSVQDFVQSVRGSVAIEHAAGEWTVYQIEAPFGYTTKRLLGVIYRFHHPDMVLKESEVVIRILDKQEAEEAFSSHIDVDYLHWRDYVEDVSSIEVIPEHVLG